MSKQKSPETKEATAEATDLPESLPPVQETGVEKSAREYAAARNEGPPTPRPAVFSEVFYVPQLDVPNLQARYDLALAATKKLARLLIFAKKLEAEEAVVTITDKRPE